MFNLGLIAPFSLCSVVPPVEQDS